LTTPLGKPQMPGQKDEITGVPNLCPACGAVGSVAMTYNTETTELSLECSLCEAKYEGAEQAAAVLQTVDNEEACS